MRLNQVNTLRNKYETPVERIKADLNRIYPLDVYSTKLVRSALLHLSEGYISDCITEHKGPDRSTLINVLVQRYFRLKDHATISKDLHYDYSTIRRYIRMGLELIATNCKERTNDNERN